MPQENCQNELGKCPSTWRCCMLWWCMWFWSCGVQVSHYFEITASVAANLVCLCKYKFGIDLRLCIFCHHNVIFVLIVQRWKRGWRSEPIRECCPGVSRWYEKCVMQCNISEVKLCSRPIIKWMDEVWVALDARGTRNDWKLLYQNRNQLRALVSGWMFPRPHWSGVSPMGYFPDSCSYGPFSRILPIWVSRILAIGIFFHILPIWVIVSHHDGKGHSVESCLYGSFSSMLPIWPFSRILQIWVIFQHPDPMGHPN